MREISYTVPAEFDGVQAQVFLKSRGISRRVLTALKRSGGLTRGGGTLRTVDAVHAGEVITLRLDGGETSVAANPELSADVVYEDEDVVVFNKPPFMPVHPSQGHYENTLANGIAWYYRNEATPFVFRAVNRLDRDTSGLVLLAKNPYSSCVLSDAVKDHTIHREYAAIVSGKPDASGTIDLPIARKAGSTIERVCDPERGETAVTHYRTFAYNKDADISFIRLLLETGRTHQIRVHMKAIGHPLPGDFLYCPDYRFIDRQPLHSTYLRFSHPVTGEKLEFSAPLPGDMRKLFPDIKDPSGPVFY